MTPKEKALVIYERYKYALLGSGHPEQKYYAKLFAEIAVDEMIKQQQIQAEDMIWSCVNYLQEVKQEIQAL